MYIAVVKITSQQANELSIIGLNLRLLNDAGGAYNGWYQLAASEEKRERLRAWLSERPEIEHRFF